MEALADESQCLHDLLPCSGTLTGNFFLVATFAFILAYGAKLISHGSEVLLEILHPGIIGGFLLPVLGALPDAAVIFVSALGGNIVQVQKQLAIGMGTLAGSNVLLLTLPWAASLWLGRTDINEDTGKAKQKICTSRSVRRTGVTLYKDVKILARLMIATLLPFGIIQLSYVLVKSLPEYLEQTHRWWAVGSFTACCLLFISYSIYQVLDVKTQERKMERVRERRMWKRFVTTITQQVGRGEGETAKSWLLGYQAPILFEGEESKHASRMSTDSTLSRQPSRDRLKKLHHDSDESETDTDVSTPHQSGSPNSTQKNGDMFAPKSSTRRIAFRAVAYIGSGTAIILMFADPLVKSIASLAHAISFPPFYIAFVVTPIASNSSEMFATFAFSRKKEKKSLSLIFSSLYGAVAMNNTISLSVFLAMIYFRDLEWNFSAETLVVAVVVLIVGLFGSFMSTLRTYHIFWAVALYPISIALIAFLESAAIGWD